MGFAWALLCLEYLNESRWTEAALWFATWNNMLTKQEVQKTYYGRFGGQSQNQLKPKKLGGIFLKQITGSTLYLGYAFCWQSRYQDMEEGNLTLCLPPLIVPDKLTYPIAVDSIKSNSFGIPTLTKPSSSLKIPRDTSNWLRLQSHSSLPTEQLPDSQSLLDGLDHILKASRTDLPLIYVLLLSFLFL